MTFADINRYIGLGQRVSVLGRLGRKEMKKYLILPVIILAVSCSDKHIVQVDYGALAEKKVQLEREELDEVFLPSDIYAAGQDVFIVNRDRNGNVLYRYRDSRNTGSYLNYGRSGKEFIFVDRSPRDNTDSTLFLYTDYTECTELAIKEDTVEIVSQRRITDGLQNNVIVLDGSLVFYRALQESAPFCLYNTNSGEQRFFGDFKDLPINVQTKDDRDNVSLSNSVYNDSLKVLMSFYESAPVIRIYDMAGCRLVSEIRLTGLREQTASVEDFYAGDSVIYFSRPVEACGRVFVQMVNATGNETPASTDILEVGWDGSILGKYSLDQDCISYTVSQRGDFYGISVSDGLFFLCTGKLQ